MEHWIASRFASSQHYSLAQMPCIRNPSWILVPGSGGFCHLCITLSGVFWFLAELVLKIHPFCPCQTDNDFVICNTTAFCWPLCARVLCTTLLLKKAWSWATSCLFFFWGLPCHCTQWTITIPFLREWHWSPQASSSGFFSLDVHAVLNYHMKHIFKHTFNETYFIKALGVLCMYSDHLMVTGLLLCCLIIQLFSLDVHVVLTMNITWNTFNWPSSYCNMHVHWSLIYCTSPLLPHHQASFHWMYMLY